MDELVITVDTREPNPENPNESQDALFIPHVYRHANKGVPGEYVPCAVERATLDTGDYSLPGELRRWVAIERKTIADLVSTLFGGRKDSTGAQRAELLRFRAELERMRAMPAGSLIAVVVEADVDTIERELFKRPKRKAEEQAKAHRETRYAGTFAGGALPCEACPSYRWPGERCHECAARPPGEILYENVNSVALLHMCDKLALSYGVPWVWAGSRAGAERWVGGTLRWVWEEASGKGETFRKAIERGVAGFRPWLAQHAGEQVA